jgi:hypothetical protein
MGTLSWGEPSLADPIPLPAVTLGLSFMVPIRGSRRLETVIVLECIRVEFTTDDRNEQSLRALARLDLVEEGLFRNP